MGDSTVHWRWSTLPNVLVDMEGGVSPLQPHNDKVTDDTEGSHFAQEFGCSINEDHQEFVIRIARKPEAVHTVNVTVKIDRGLSEQPDGSTVFDGSVGNGDEKWGGVTTLGLTLKISQESVSKGVVEPEVEKTAEECDKCKDYIHRGLHYHCTKCEAPCPKCKYGHRAPNSQQAVSKGVVEPEEEKTREECDERKDYIHHGLHYYCTKCEAPCLKCKYLPKREQNSQQAMWTNQAYWDPSSHQTRTDDGEAAYWDDMNFLQAWQQPDYGANSQHAWTNQAYRDPNSHQITWADGGEAVCWDDVNSQQAWEQSLEYAAEAKHLDMIHQQIINIGLLNKAIGEWSEAGCGLDDRPSHGTLCSQRLGCSPCGCFDCHCSRKQYGYYPCFCTDCCSSIVRCYVRVCHIRNVVPSC